MIVTGECTACRRAFVARGRLLKRDGPEWTVEPATLACAHWSDVYEAINLAAIKPDGRAGSGAVRARRDSDSPSWTLRDPSLGGRRGDRARLSLPNWSLYRGDALIASVRARDADVARQVFRSHGLGRPGDRLRKHP